MNTHNLKRGARNVKFATRSRVTILRKLHALTVLAILFTPCLSAQRQLSNRGKDFWVGFGHHQFMELGSTGTEMVLYLSAEQAATVTVTLKGTTGNQVQTYNVPANTTITTTPIPRSGVYDARLYTPSPPAPGGTGSEGVFAKGIHIQSNVPIVAYAHIYSNASSGATLLLPTDAWGLSYVSVNSAQSYDAKSFSWIYVVAKENNTVVEITPSVASRMGRPAGVPFTVTLNEGEIYQLLAGPEAGTVKNQLTGTTVRAVANSSGISQPFAVFSGSSRTYGETSFCSGSGGDNDMQQAFPTQAWGTRYLTAPFSSAGTVMTPSAFQNSVYKVIPRWPNTVVRRNGAILTNLVNGYYTFASNQPELIEADLPIMVGQFMGTGTPCNNGSLGDPEMVYLTALDQGIKSAGFFRNSQDYIQFNYVTVIVPSAGQSSLRINNSNTFDHTYDHPRMPGYKVAIKGWPAAQAQVQISCDSTFTAITYGLGIVESYGYNAGVLVLNLDVWPAMRTTSGGSAIGDTIPAGASFRFSVRSPHHLTSITWKLSAMAGLSPSTDVILTGPVASDSVMINGRQWYTYLTPGSYTASIAGEHSVPIVYSFPLLENTGQTGSTTYKLTVTGSVTAVNSLADAAADLRLSPNPARGMLKVHYTGRTAGQLTARLLSMQGTNMIRPVVLSGDKAVIDMNRVPAGVYVLILTNSRTGNTIQKQVVKL